MADNETISSTSGAADKPNKPKPIKNLPTERVGKENQFAILRAFAKASDEQGRAGVSNADVARFATLRPDSISTCNPFFNDAGLLVREGIKQRPVEAVFAYDQAAQWEAANPGAKLGPVLAQSWFGRPLLAKLSLQTMSVNEALAFLADECRAPAEYKPQIQLLLDYLEFACLIEIDGSTVRRVKDVPPTPAEGSQAVAGGVMGEGGATGRVGEPVGVGLDLDPLLIALLQKIPTTGEPWPKERRLRWFKTFAMNVSQVYDGEDDPVELTITATAVTNNNGGAP